MRTSKYIIEHFLIKDGLVLNDYDTKLNDSQSPAVKLSTAMKVLNIDEMQFEKIPFIADKQSYLHYKYHLVFFEICIANYDDKYWIQLDKFRRLAKQSYLIIQNSPLITKHKDLYSKFSQGLSHIHQKREQYETSQSNESTMEDLLTSTINVGPKKGGVMPGFMAEHLSDIVEWCVSFCENNEEKLITFIDTYQGNIEIIREKFKDEFNQYMYKFNFKTNDITLPYASGQTNVYLDPEDVQRTSNVQKSYQWGELAGNITTAVYVYAKNTTAIEVNKEAICETLSNDNASMYMRVQKQKLFRTTYSNDALKIMAQAKWEKGSEQFGDKHSKPLQGGNDDTNNYRARMLVMPREGITSLTDTSILNAPALLIPLLITGDYDKIGSQGQNLLITLHSCNKKTGEKTWEIIGIDFGHSFRNENPMVENNLILADGRFSQTTFNPFKNYSALTDGSVSEKMRGVLKIAKARGSIKLSNNVINSYGPEFSKSIQDIPSGEGAVICKNYADTIKTLSELNYDYEEECNELIKTIHQLNNRMQNNMDKGLKIFKDNLPHPANIIDLADHLNKRCATLLNKTTLRSRNKKHGLNYLVIDINYRKTWKIEFNRDNHQYTLSCPYTSSELKIIIPGLNKIKSSNSAFERIDGKLCLSFHKIHANEICDIFHELQLQREYFGKDFIAVQTGKIELRLQDLIKAPWFLEENIEMDLMLNPGNKKQYRIILHVTDGKKLAKNLAQLIGNEFNQPLKDNSLIWDFDSDAMSLLSMIDHLQTIQDKYELILEAKRKPIIEIKPVMIEPIPVINIEPPKDEQIIINEIPLTDNIIALENFPLPENTEVKNCLTESFIFVTHDCLTSFKLALNELVKLHESEIQSESYLYKIGKNLKTFIWVTPDDSPLSFIPKFKEYTSTMEPTNTEEIIKLLEKLQASQNENILIQQALDHGYQVLNQVQAILTNQMVTHATSPI